MGFLFAPENLPFTVSLVVMMALAIVEALSVIAGGGVSHLLDSLIPHHDLHLDADGGAPGVLGWLHFGKVPILILIVLFLTAFGLAGFLIQLALRGILGSPAPAFLASIPAFVFGLFAVRICGSLLGRIMPKDETTAVSQDSLIGRIAVITIGTARRGEPAEARLKDQFGQTHYVMVQPDLEPETFAAGSEVLLVKRTGAIYHGIANPNPALVDK